MQMTTQELTESREVLAALPESLQAQLLIELPKHCHEKVIGHFTPGEVLQKLPEADWEEAGAVIPLVLQKLNIDPAIGSSALLTTVTDIIGFFSFLGLASIILL